MDDDDVTEFGLPISLFVDPHDPQAAEKALEQIQRLLVEFRAQQKKRADEEDEFVRRARFPGFFKLVLDTQAASIPTFCKAEFVAQDHLESRVAKLEELVAHILSRTEL